MNKLSELANKFKIKLAQVANQATPSLPNSVAPADDAQLLEAGEAVKAELINALGMKNVGPEDIKFTKLRFVDSGGKKSVEWAMTVSPAAAKQFQAGVATQRQSNPSFAVPRFVAESFGQKLPGVALMPAQPITVG